MKAAFRVGDRVTISWGSKPMEATITEDRGLLGVGGRRLYQIEIPLDPFDPIITEFPEEEIAPFDRTNGHAPLRRAAIIEFFKFGGLALILRSNIAGGKLQPRVWLRHDSNGNITYTFAEERGRVGGESVPARALREGRIFAPKRDEVLKYLRSFGLSKAQAEDVIAEVGTVPD